MTQDQIEQYEYCKKHLADIELYIKSLPFKNYKYGCSSGCARIERSLEEIHGNMYRSVMEAINKAKTEIRSKIDAL